MRSRVCSIVLRVVFFSLLFVFARPSVADWDWSVLAPNIEKQLEIIQGGELEEDAELGLLDYVFRTTASPKDLRRFLEAAQKSSKQAVQVSALKYYLDLNPEAFPRFLSGDAVQRACAAYWIQSHYDPNLHGALQIPDRLVQSLNIQYIKTAHGLHAYSLQALIALSSESDFSLSRESVDHLFEYWRAAGEIEPEVYALVLATMVKVYEWDDFYKPAIGAHVRTYVSDLKGHTKILNLAAAVSILGLDGKHLSAILEDFKNVIDEDKAVESAKDSRPAARIERYARGELLKAVGYSRSPKLLAYVRSQGSDRQRRLVASSMAKYYSGLAALSEVRHSLTVNLENRFVEAQLAEVATWYLDQDLPPGVRIRIGRALGAVDPAQLAKKLQGEPGEPVKSLALAYAVYRRDTKSTQNEDDPIVAFVAKDLKDIPELGVNDFIKTIKGALKRKDISDVQDALTGLHERFDLTDKKAASLVKFTASEEKALFDRLGELDDAGIAFLDILLQSNYKVSDKNLGIYSTTVWAMNSPRHKVVWMKYIEKRMGAFPRGAVLLAEALSSPSRELRDTSVSLWGNTDWNDFFSGRSKAASKEIEEFVERVRLATKSAHREVREVASATFDSLKSNPIAEPFFLAEDLAANNAVERELLSELKKNIEKRDLERLFSRLVDGLMRGEIRPGSPTTVEVIAAALSHQDRDLRTTSVATLALRLRQEEIPATAFSEPVLASLRQFISAEVRAPNVGEVLLPSMELLVAVTENKADDRLYGEIYSEILRLQKEAGGDPEKLDVPRVLELTRALLRAGEGDTDPSVREGMNTAERLETWCSVYLKKQNP